MGIMVKHRVHVTLEQYKVRLHKLKRTNHQGTFPSVAKMNNISLLLSLATDVDQPLKQFDVKNVFLHGHLEKEVHMEMLPGLSKDSTRNKVCRLKKAPWFGRFTKVWYTYDFVESRGSHIVD